MVDIGLLSDISNNFCTQWGYVYASSETQTPVNFLISFTTDKSFGIAGTINDYSASGSLGYRRMPYYCSKTGFTVTSVKNNYYLWFASGY